MNSCKENIDEFIENKFKIYRSYYISNKDISDMIKGTGCCYNEIIVDLIPSKLNIKSGVFGEITTTEIYKST